MNKLQQVLLSFLIEHNCSFVDKTDQSDFYYLGLLTLLDSLLCLPLMLIQFIIHNANLEVLELGKYSDMTYS